MLSISSTKRVESKEFPGVAYTVRVLSEGVRNRASMSLANALVEIRTARAELDMLDLPKDENGDIADKEIDPLQTARVLSLMDKVERINRTEIDPVWMRTAFISIEGLEIDGQSEGLTADQIIESA